MPEPPSSISPWRVLLPVGLGTTLSLMGDTALYAILPTHTVQAGVAVASVGILLSANRWIRLLLNGPAGVLYDRWPRRSLFVPAMFVGALSTLLYAVTTGFWPLFVGRLLWGVAWSGIWVGGNTIILDVTTDRDRGRWTGLYQLSFYLGGTVGFPLGGLLTDWLGYHQAFAVATALTTVGALVALLVLPETRGLRLTPRPPLLTGTSQSGEGASEANRPSVLDARHLAKHPERSEWASPATSRSTPSEANGRQPTRRSSLISATALYGVNRFVVAGMISSTLGLLLAQQWGESLRLGELTLGIATFTGLALGLSTLISMAAAPLAGLWSDRLGNRWWVAAAGLAAGAVGMGLLAAGSLAAILPGIVLSAITSGSNQNLATVIVGDEAAALRRGRSLGLMHTIGDMASAIAPPLAYVALPRVGLPGLYLVCTALLLAMLAWTLYLVPKRPASAAAGAR